MAGKAKRTVDPEGKRQAILRSAADHFARYGFEKASTADIAKDAGCGVGTVFRIFSTKEELANAVFQEACRLHAAAHDESAFDAKGASSPREQFHRLFQVSFAMIERHPNEYIFFEMSYRADFLTELSRYLASQLRQRIVTWLEGLQAEGIILAAPPQVLLAITIGAIVRLMRESRTTQTHLNRELLDSLEALCWRAIACEPHPGTPRHQGDVAMGQRVNAKP